MINFLCCQTVYYYRGETAISECFQCEIFIDREAKRVVNKKILAYAFEATFQFQEAYSRRTTEKFKEVELKENELVHRPSICYDR